MNTQRRILILAAAGCAAASLAACSSGSGETATESPEAGMPATTAATAPSGSSPGSDATLSDAADSPSTVEGSLPAGSPEGTDSAAASDACASDQLQVTLANQQGAAGSQIADLVFTNTSTSACSLKGYPGVSAVTNNDGTQLGPAATRETATEPTLVHLGPGQTASASVKINNVGVFAPDTCQPESADGLRIYPPNETRSLYVEVPGLQGCAGEVDYLSVQPLTAS